MAIAAVVFAAGMLAARDGQAASEARCNALGGNCICSEPLAGPFTRTQDTDGHPRINPDDTTPTDKQCTYLDEPPGFAIQFPMETPTQTITRATATQEPAAFAALPAGHTVTAVGKSDFHSASLGYGGNLGHLLTDDTQYRGRVGFRYYVYHSPNFEFSGDGQCQNYKIAHFGAANGGGAYITSNSGEDIAFQQSDLILTNGNGCCTKGPAGAQAWQPGGVTGGHEDVLQPMRGRWIRFEVLVASRAGGAGGTYVLVYQKDVTNNGPELVRVDTRIRGDCWQGFGCGWPIATRQPSSGPINLVATNWNRFMQCNGYRLFTHFLTAGWSTDTGQRIGAAVEVEGTGIPVPPAPSNLTVQ
jgi:hypothetical protein